MKGTMVKSLPEMDRTQIETATRVGRCTPEDAGVMLAGMEPSKRRNVMRYVTVTLTLTLTLSWSLLREGML